MRGYIGGPRRWVPETRALYGRYICGCEDKDVSFGGKADLIGVYWLLSRKEIILCWKRKCTVNIAKFRVLIY